MYVTIAGNEGFTPSDVYRCSTCLIFFNQVEFALSVDCSRL